ncbi:hypothetical protein I551_5978 [Mycobacterium ulcerans str. Harvey]|uniref:Uncharacterized protein n=1 Tax=Mycobacterium ulcerans str. Harvey TaxID=1299332 RepID=A0ABN0QS49_MYCUL|nr:hypothetical protein I551_5978 [Mycobacterium ulcerans str. Harvey]
MCQGRPWPSRRACRGADCGGVTVLVVALWRFRWIRLAMISALLATQGSGVVD